LRGGSQNLTDLRIFAMSIIRILPPELLSLYIHPRLYELHSMAPEVGMPSQRDGENAEIVLPPYINLSSERMVRHGLYLMDTGDQLLLWVARAVPPQMIQEIFDRPSFDALPSGKVHPCNH
jgi:protein transport protein SEC24